MIAMLTDLVLGLYRSEADLVGLLRLYRSEEDLVGLLGLYRS